MAFHRGWFQALIFFLSFINDISSFAVEACVLNMYADDVIIYTSETSKDECRLQVCIHQRMNVGCKSVLITYLIGIV